jgi:hypothetical protein
MQEKQVDHSSKMKHNVSTPEGVPRLFDLVRVQDERMKLAFYAALGNTVVAKDLDQVNSSFIVYLLFFFTCIMDELRKIDDHVIRSSIQFFLKAY